MIPCCLQYWIAPIREREPNRSRASACLLSSSTFIESPAGLAQFECGDPSGRAGVEDQIVVPRGAPCSSIAPAVSRFGGKAECSPCLEHRRATGRPADQPEQVSSTEGPKAAVALGHICCELPATDGLPPMHDEAQSATRKATMCMSSWGLSRKTMRL